jgi:hypothetical protein
MSLIYRGLVRDGVVVLPADAALVEGAEVFVLPRVDVARESAGGGSGAIWATLSELGRRTEAVPCDLPEDLARHHDHYLHGTPKT